jgi:hypothetical protein
MLVYETTYQWLWCCLKVGNPQSSPWLFHGVWFSQIVDAWENVEAQWSRCFRFGCLTFFYWTFIYLLGPYSEKDHDPILRYILQLCELNVMFFTESSNMTWDSTAEITEMVRDGDCLSLPGRVKRSTSLQRHWSRYCIDPDIRTA